MSWSRSATLATWVGSLAAVAGVIIAYRAYAHSHDQPGQQSFTVVINSSTQSLDVAGDRTKDISLDFEVRKCQVGPKLVSCSLTVLSPRYDRRFLIDQFQTRLIDADGDNFHLSTEMINTTLERDHGLPFKLGFDVNKEVVRPLTVRMFGFVDNQALDKGFEIK